MLKFTVFLLWSAAMLEDMLFIFTNVDLNELTEKSNLD